MLSVCRRWMRAKHLRTKSVSGAGLDKEGESDLVRYAHCTEWELNSMEDIASHRIVWLVCQKDI